MRNKLVPHRFQGRFFTLPVIGAGVHVQEILAKMALGKSVEAILDEHPGLERTTCWLA